jgi:hypothetical protein
MFGYRNTINAFYEIESYTYRQEKSNSIVSEITNKGKEYILGVDENEFIDYLIQKYSLEPLIVDKENPSIYEPSVSKEWVEDRMWRGKYQADVYTFTIIYKFTGSSELFKVKPDTWTMTTTEISVNEQNSTVSFSFKLYRQDPAEFNNAKRDFENRAFANLQNVNNLVNSWNNSIKELAASTFQEHKRKFRQENDFFAAINVKVNSNTSSVFTAPTIKKKIIPQPTVNSKKEFSSEPMMSKEMYNDVLKVIYDSGKNMEKKPALYQNKDEEGLRDQFLFVLETRYDGTTASGETFNRSGKTDILLKYANDGSNLFVAECKFWHGINEFQKAISQLFDRYLTWRDSKTALIMFVTNKDFTNVIETVKKEINVHPYFSKLVGQRGETSFSYLFHLPQDNQKPVQLEIMLFHYDK